MWYKKELADYLSLKTKISEDIDKAPTSSGKPLQPSVFYRDMKFLVDETKKILELERGAYWYADLWQERSLQIAILEASLAEVKKDSMYSDDLTLYCDAHIVERSITTSLFPSVYNEFKDRLVHILENIKLSQMHRNYDSSAVKLRVGEAFLLAEQAYSKTLENSETAQDLRKRMKEITNTDLINGLKQELSLQFSVQINKIKKSYAVKEAALLKELDDKNAALRAKTVESDRNTHLISKFKEKYQVQYLAVKSDIMGTPANSPTASRSVSRRNSGQRLGLFKRPVKSPQTPRNEAPNKTPDGQKVDEFENIHI